MSKKKRTFKITKLEDSVIIESDSKRYEVFFDKPEYGCFFGEPGQGGFISIEPASSAIGKMKLEYWPVW